MTGWRVGYVAGDAAIIGAFRRLKTNIDSGTPDFIQDAACVALEEEEHVAALRREYRQKRDIIVAAFADAGLPACAPESTLYVWQRLPEGIDSVAFAQLLLDDRVAVVVTPGRWISQPASGDGRNPGEQYVRLALVPTLEATERAAERIRSLLPGLISEAGPRRRRRGSRG
jgi:LL-diaminopimelate aminotransferase